jgi:hypothetical protein
MNRVQTYSPSPIPNGEQWIREGWELARRENEAAFETVEIQHTAELAAWGVRLKEIEARGSTLLDRRTALDVELDQRGFTHAEHLRQVAQGKADLRWSIALLILNAALALFVLLAFGPIWLSGLLALLVLVSALPVEEFFHALDERAALREGTFLALSILALAAQFWLGTVRGLFLAALIPADAGSVTHSLGKALPILQATLGVFSVVSEIVCGYKLNRVRSHLLSATARAARERDAHTQELSRLYKALEIAKAEPGIRRAYRTIGVRQSIAWMVAEKERVEANHLKRALKGALIALAIVTVLILLATRLSADTLPHRNVVSVLDLSKSVSPINFRANLAATSSLLSKLHPGDRMVIVGVTDSFGMPRILFDETLPRESGYLNFEAKAAQETIAARWQGFAKDLKPTYGRTDVIGTLSIVSYLAGMVSHDTYLFVFGDLQNSTHEIDLEHQTRIPVDRLINRLRETHAVPRLKDCNIFLLGIDPVGKSALYFRDLREFWFSFFREAGANVRRFSIDRTIPEF